MKGSRWLAWFAATRVAAGLRQVFHADDFAAETDLVKYRREVVEEAVDGPISTCGKALLMRSRA